MEQADAWIATYRQFWEGTFDALADYTALFGWTREDMDMGGLTYSMFKNGGASGWRNDCASA